MLFFAIGVLGVSPANGPGVTILAGVPPPCILATQVLHLFFAEPSSVSECYVLTC
jgi:hypothetical protein